VKECPKCKRTFFDDTISFCLDDGHLLSPKLDEESTLIHVNASQDRTTETTLPSTFAGFEREKSIHVEIREVYTHQPDISVKYDGMVYVFIVRLFLISAGPPTNIREFEAGMIWNDRNYPGEIMHVRGHWAIIRDEWRLTDGRPVTESNVHPIMDDHSLRTAEVLATGIGRDAWLGFVVKGVPITDLPAAQETPKSIEIRLTDALGREYSGNASEPWPGSGKLQWQG
jgi:hypothetical protein